MIRTTVNKFEEFNPNTIKQKLQKHTKCKNRSTKLYIYMVVLVICLTSSQNITVLVI